jgi:membrane protease YdiL (CAAX protease family)
MNERAAISRPFPHVRAAVWVLLIALTFAANHICWRVGWTLSLISRDVVQALPLLGAVLALLLVFWSPARFGLTLGNHRKAWWAYMAAGVLFGAYYALRGHLLPRDILQTIGEHTRPSAYLLTPFREELLFRGFMYGVLAEMYAESEASSRWLSRPVVITAVLFGLWHWPWIPAVGWLLGSANILFTVGVGLVFGIIRRRSGSVLGPFVLHAVGNFVAGL